jgi:hypothetical protein
MSVNKLPSSTACFEKELYEYICCYTSLQFLFNTVILKSDQNVPLQRVWDLIAQKCKLLCSDAELLGPLMCMTSFGYVSVFMALQNFE